MRHSIRDSNSGKFCSTGSEQINDQLNVKLSTELKEEVKKISKGEMSKWVRQAILERLNREAVLAIGSSKRLS